MSRQAPSDHTEAILGAVALSAQRLAEVRDWEEAVPDVLAWLGEASNASRVYVFRNLLDDQGRLCMDEAFEWVAEGIEATIGHPDNHSWPYVEGYTHYEEVMRSGGIMQTQLAGLDEASEMERQDFQDEGILATAFVPIAVGGEWWGFLGFDDCLEERSFSDLEIHGLRTAAAILAAAIHRGRLEERVADSEERFRTLVEHIPAALYIDEPGEELITTYVGPQLEPMLGISAERWMTEDEIWQNNMHPDDRDRIVEEYQQAQLSDATNVIQEYRMIRPDDGRVVWVRDDTTLLRDRQGDLTMIMGVMFDITAQKEAELALAEAQERYRNLVENIPAVVYLDPVESSQRTLYVSPRIEALLGVTAEDYIQNVDLWESMIHPDDHDIAVDVYDKFLDGQGYETFTYRMIRPDDGRVVWIQDTSAVITDADGKPVLVQGFFMDVTAQKEAEAQLAEAQTQYQTLVERIPVAVYTEAADSSPGHFYMSPQIENVTGHPASAFTDATFWESHLHPDDHERIMAADERSVETGEPFAAEYRFATAEGGWVWLREQALNFKGPQGEDLVFGVISDITAQKEAEAMLAAAQTQYQSLVEGIPAMVYLDPPEGHESAIYVSPQIESILGVTAEAYQADPDLWFKIIHVDDQDRVQEVNDEHLALGKPLSIEYRVIHPDGSVRWVNEQAEVLKDEDGKPFLIQGVIFDITERKEAEEQIAFLAFHDALTKLANRAMFEELLEPAMARARRNDMAVAVMFLDLDKFKEVNDTHGHAVGDELLKQVAHRLVECVRDTDLVARQGGDEFLVLLSDLEPGDESDIARGRSRAIEVAESLAERIRSAMRVPIRVGDIDIATSASIGISVFPFDAADARTLLKHADSAMYESKRTRPGSFAIHARTEADPMTSESLAWRLRRAVRDQSWDLHYQPVVALADGRMIGAEALLRWRRPEGDFIPPAEFIPLAEEMGLLEIIGEWVFEEICRQRTEWLRQGIDLTIGFNLSPRQLWQRDLVERLAIGLRSTGLSPGDILIEVAESTAMTDPARTQRVLWGLHEEGFKIAIDDFGTGYSPAARIWNLPIDVLKIDQPLVRDLGSDAQVESFVGAVIEFAGEHGTVVHAEGIETQDQRAALVAMGCTHGQGYLFSRPLPPSDLTGLFGRGGGLVEASESP